MKGNKGVRQTIPKGFHHFHIEWDGGGFAQIIETGSFPKDFGIDTIAGKLIFVLFFINVCWYFLYCNLTVL